MTDRPSYVKELFRRIGRVEEEIGTAKRMASESLIAAEDFQRIVTGHVDEQMKGIRKDLAMLQSDTTGQSSTLDFQTQQLKTLESHSKTLESKVDQVITAVEAKRKLEEAEEKIVKRYDERVRRIAATAGVVGTALAVLAWVATHIPWPFR